MHRQHRRLERWRMADFAENLITLRKARGLTQQELADLLGVQPRLLGRWERGQGRPHFDYIVKLADVLEVTIDRLARGADDGQTERFAIRNKKLQELCRRVDELNPDDQDLICHFLDMAVRSDQVKKLFSDSGRAARR
jgi:transcriptional regulator with XRE-family HTH domain